LHSSTDTPGQVDERAQGFSDFFFCSRSGTLFDVANAIFTSQLEPSYDDVIEQRYHFPKRYLKQAEQTVGDWIIYYESRRESSVTSPASGRQCYFATARVERIERDSKKDDHYYAYVSNYLAFIKPVPFREGTTYYETSLRKENGSTNKGKFGWALRILPAEEYRTICQLGFVDAETNDQPQQPMVLAGGPVEYWRPRRMQLMERRFRDAAFARVVQKAYESTCAMTGLKLINGGGRCEIEAAHIKPVSKDGPDSPRNGIALSRTIHWMFDKHFLSISDKGEILVAKKYVPEPVRRLLNPDGRIRLPSATAWQPHPFFLRYHRDLFKGD
jgi:putative restriction endonuclease